MRVFLAALFISVTLFSCRKEEPEYAQILFSNVFYISENTYADVYVGTVHAIDDVGQSEPIYSIAAGNDGNAFKIDSLTGIISVNNANVLDFETQPAFALKIKVAKAGKPDAVTSEAVTIQLRNAGITTNGLVSYFTFKNNLRDSITKYTATGTIYDAYFTDRFDRPNNDYQFIGYKSYIKMDSVFDYPQRTISFWYSAVNIDDYEQVIYSVSGSGLKNGSVKVSVKLYNEKEYLIVQAADINDSIPTSMDDWHNLIIVQRKATFTCYQDGTLFATHNASNLTTQAGLTATVLGADHTLSKSYFQGDIDDILIYNKALGLPDLKLIYSEPALAQ